MPRQNTRLSNFTFVQRNNAAPNAVSMLIRGGADYHMMNGVVSSPGLPCLRLNSATTVQTTGTDEAGVPKFDSVNMQCGGTSPFVGTSGVTAAEVATIFGAGTNNNSTFTTTLASVFVNGANETGRPAFNASTINSFFVNTAYVGAVRDASDTRFNGWTCNSSTASFGTASGNCSAIPTT